MSFNRRLGAGNICGESSSPIGSTKELKCERVSVRSHALVVALAENIDMYESPQLRDGSTVCCATCTKVDSRYPWVTLRERMGEVRLSSLTDHSARTSRIDR